MNNNLSLKKILPVTSKSDHTILIFNIISLIDQYAIWLSGLLFVGIIATSSINSWFFFNDFR